MVILNKVILISTSRYIVRRPVTFITHYIYNHCTTAIHQERRATDAHTRPKREKENFKNGTLPSDALWAACARAQPIGFGV